jgi:NADP-dependent 3-hydroxy acid dehydrogenase YdfG
MKDPTHLNESTDIVADVSKKTDVDLMIEKIIHWKGTLDIAVNNAGRILKRKQNKVSQLRTNKI